MIFEKPHIIIAGVNKAGTTSLFTYLSKHPQINASSVKETCYFLPLRYNKKLNPIDEYQNYFKVSHQIKYLLESTPGYFYGGKNLVAAVKATLPNAKLIFSFRDPVDRLISFYKFKKNHLELDSDITFKDYVDQCMSIKKSEFVDQKLNTFFGVEGGKYIDYIKDWKVFDEKSKSYIDFNLLKHDPHSCLNSLCDWLDLDKSFYENYSFNIENKSRAVKNRGLQKVALSINKNLESVFRENQKIKNSLRNIYYKINASKVSEQIDKKVINDLQNFYEPYNQALYNYMKQVDRTDIPNWLFKYSGVAPN